MKIPSQDQAEQMLQESAVLNPGPWVSHSKKTAEAAKIIAKHCFGLDEEPAYILGLLHDIGRRFGITDMRHVFDGYNYLLSQGFDDAAQICLSHSFPLQDTRTFAGVWDCDEKEYQQVNGILKSFTYTSYDRLIQLCDCLAMPTGFCLMEKRFIDVALRRNLNENYQERWQAYFDIRDEFNQILGYSVYRLLPGVIEHTFDFKE
ncbi:MAG: HD domain-containing protein [Anaerolineaceae bacterium]|nr:HD domain-containing protein [Anaerolineaceae bacterium]